MIRQHPHPLSPSIQSSSGTERFYRSFELPIHNPPQSTPPETSQFCTSQSSTQSIASTDPSSRTPFGSHMSREEPRLRLRQTRQLMTCWSRFTLPLRRRSTLSFSRISVRSRMDEIRMMASKSVRQWPPQFWHPEVVMDHLRFCPPSCPQISPAPIS